MACWRKNRCRTPEAMRADPVYADFMLPGWLEAERRAAAESERAEIESRRAAAESQRAETEARRADAEAGARAAAERRAAAEAQARREAETQLAELRAQLAARPPS